MSEVPRRIQLSRAKGWRMPPDTVSVARPGPFGNPFRIGDEGVPDAAAAVRLFRVMVEKQQEALRNTDELFYFQTVRIQSYLRGKNLACWCKLCDPCHADVLLKIANAA